MIDRGLTEQKVRGAAGVTASERAERASIGEASKAGLSLKNRERPAFDVVTEAALARMPRGQRQEARAELRREAREAEHAKHVAERSAERRAKRKELSRDDRLNRAAPSRAPASAAMRRIPFHIAIRSRRIDRCGYSARKLRSMHPSIARTPPRTSGTSGDLTRWRRANAALNRRRDDAAKMLIFARDDDELEASYEAYDDSAYEPAMRETETRVSTNPKPR